ncbi:hypothetical protein AJ78_02203 [Emergomyces pasteurianus Ep9510]|uniref:PHD-type domain-containing protein n=1 Tax=Emergomyces pasteurianus Ep9510 TaxID=1447872 RepID=A0A1J9PMS0_9EURO|nr:hypothetical protein AJ78_02203 [Emergomyces pasteurianus Ep9510]
MASQDQYPRILPKVLPNSPQPDCVLNYNPRPQQNGVPTSTSLSTSTATSHDPSDRPTTTYSSVANPLNIPKLSAATAELLARANGSWRISQNDGAAMNSSNNSTGENVCSTPSGSSLEMMVSTALDGEGKVETEQAKDVWTLRSNSSLSHDNHTPNEMMTSTDIQTPTTPGSIDIRNTVKPSDNVTPTSSNLIRAKIVHLRNIAPHPGSPPLATPTSGSKRQRTLTTTATTTITRRRRSGPKGTRRRKAGRRNHIDDEEGVIKADDSSSDKSSDEATPVTTQTKSGRQIHRPAVFYPALPATGSGSPTGPDASSSSQPRKRRRICRKGKETNAICKRCERGHSPAGNAIVFCDDCNRPWHQFCHDPPIEKEVITVKELEWFCKECRPPVDALSDEMPPPSNIQQFSANRIDTSNFLPVLPSETKVGGAKFSLEQKRGYLCRLSHSDLVSLLLDISDSIPDFPIFPENLPDLPSSTLIQPTPQPPTIQLNMSDKPPLISGQSTTSVSTLGTQNSLTTPQSSVAGQSYLPPANVDLSAIVEEKRLSPKHDDTPSDDDDDDGDDDYVYIEDHRLYPRAGNGFRLPPDSEDLDMLLEDPACPTFSHSLHGPAKSKMLETSGLPIVVEAAA